MQAFNPTIVNTAPPAMARSLRETPLRIYVPEFNDSCSGFDFFWQRPREETVCEKKDVAEVE